ncbi:MAG TPA: Ku protein, partial [Candidatus Angelobacter sp.]|nr:Ku protein [Candidatus Angelobacter sp.]
MASTVWKGHLTFGLLSLPVKLYSAARSESVGFNQLHKGDNSRVKQVLYCQLEDKPIPRSEIVKG